MPLHTFFDAIVARNFQKDVAVGCNWRPCHCCHADSGCEELQAEQSMKDSMKPTAAAAAAAMSMAGVHSGAASEAAGSRHDSMREHQQTDMGSPPVSEPDGDADTEQDEQQRQWPAALLPRPQQQQPQQPQSMHHGGSFKTYMDHKNLKLQEQFEMQALGQAPRSDLFKGVSIHVNGLTVPSLGELKQLMALHGGR
jgi:hypothetical protein